MFVEQKSDCIHNVKSNSKNDSIKEYVGNFRMITRDNIFVPNDLDLITVSYTPNELDIEMFDIE